MPKPRRKTHLRCPKGHEFEGIPWLVTAMIDDKEVLQVKVCQLCAVEALGKMFPIEVVEKETDAKAD